MRDYFKKRFSNHTAAHHPTLVKGFGIGQAYLWTFTHRFVRRAFLIGLFCAMLPIPFQMVLVTVFAIFIKANLPVSLGLVWVSNPVTYPIILWLNYQLGNFVLEGRFAQFELTKIVSNWQDFLAPLTVGSLISGAVLGLLGYWLIGWIYFSESQIRQSRKLK